MCNYRPIEVRATQSNHPFPLNPHKQVLKEEKEGKAAAEGTIVFEEKLEVPERKCSKMWIRRSLEFTGKLNIPFHLEVKYLNYISFNRNEL